jgi:hypothetical protein
MKKLSILLICSLLWACSKENAVQPANGELVGTYNVITDPIRCSLPTTNQVIVAKVGDNYRVSYLNWGTKIAGIYENIVAEKTGNEYKLTVDGKEFGKYIKDTYRDFDGQKEGMVLYLRNGNFEFMGNQ